MQEEKMNIKRCPNCGNESNIDEAKFCQKCGAEFTFINANDEIDTAGELNEMQNEKRIIKKCPNCGNESADDEAKFCQSCGAEFITVVMKDETDEESGTDEVKNFNTNGEECDAMICEDDSSKITVSNIEVVDIFEKKSNRKVKLILTVLAIVIVVGIIVGLTLIFGGTAKMQKSVTGDWETYACGSGRAYFYDQLPESTVETLMIELDIYDDNSFWLYIHEGTVFVSGKWKVEKSGIINLYDEDGDDLPGATLRYEKNLDELVLTIEDSVFYFKKKY